MYIQTRLSRMTKLSKGYGHRSRHVTIKCNHLHNENPWSLHKCGCCELYFGGCLKPQSYVGARIGLLWPFPWLIIAPAIFGVSQHFSFHRTFRTVLCFTRLSHVVEHREQLRALVILKLSWRENTTKSSQKMSRVTVGFGRNASSL
jgi:hypothetical protein